MQLNVINARLSPPRRRRRRRPSGPSPATSCTSTSTSAPRTCPAGTRLAIGNAVIEVTEQPHTGCAKFAARFGKEALRFVNVGVGKQLRLRGLNAKVVTPGTIRRGDTHHQGL